MVLYCYQVGNCQHMKSVPCVFVGAGISRLYSAGLQAGWLGGLSLDRGWEFISSLPCPDQLWGPPRLLFSGYQGLFSLEVKWPVREADYSPHLVPRLRMRWFIPPLPNTPSWRHSPIRLHGVVLSYKNIGTLYFFCINYLRGEEKLIITQRINKFPAFYGIRKLIAVSFESKI